MINIPKNILAPTDFSEVSKVAVGYAAKLADAVHASLHLHHVAPDPKAGHWAVESAGMGHTLDQTAGNLREKLDTLLTAEERANLTIESYVGFGPPADQIVDYAAKASKKSAALAKKKAPERRGGIKKKTWLGSVTEKVSAFQANMPSPPAPRFGPYEIQAPLEAAGAWAEVYKARDTRLGPDRRHQGAARACRRGPRAKAAVRARGTRPSPRLSHPAHLHRSVRHRQPGPGSTSWSWSRRETPGGGSLTRYTATELAMRSALTRPGTYGSREPGRNRR